MLHVSKKHVKHMYSTMNAYKANIHVIVTQVTK